MSKPMRVYMICFSVFALLGIFSFESPNGIDLDAVNYPAFESWSHPFGCDRLGRDIYALFSFGILSTLLVAIPARLLTIAFASCVSLFAYVSNRLLGFILDQLSYVFLSIPSLLIALLIVSGLGANFITLPLAILLSDWANAYETIKSKLKEINQSSYIHSSYVMGAGKVHVFRFHILPSLVSIFSFLFVTGVPNVIMAIALFSFLGVDWSGDFLGPGLGEQIAFSADYFDKSLLAVIMPVFGIVSMIVGIGRK
jgi:peptide/nickel transport system permease protein